jgi:hypothetical protein
MSHVDGRVKVKKGKGGGSQDVKNLPETLKRFFLQGCNIRAVEIGLGQTAPLFLWFKNITVSASFENVLIHFFN